VMVVLFTCGWSFPALSQNADLVGRSWQLVKFHGGDDKTLVPADRSKYTVAFAKEGVSVRIDCNRGHSMWKSTGPNQLEFGPMALTRAMCPPAEVSNRLTKDWGNVRSYVLKDGHLFLSLIADAGIYEFEPLPADAKKASAQGPENTGSAPGPAASPTLENTYWSVTKVGDTDVPPAHGPRGPHLILNAEAHRAGGSGGCNGIMGKYELEGDRLTFPGMAATRMACKQGMDTEHAFLNALNQTKAWRITGETLELLDGEGRIVARFETHTPKN
jgi:heat shock protein HslJ